ncbi:MAG: type II secretion system protein [Limisphaerales bacterium]
MKTVTGDKWRVTRKESFNQSHATRHPSLVTCRAFTMIEIAISLAVIGIALVAIIGVLPLGMSVQRENREETVINQDATILMEAIRNGARGLDDLTNYVYAITNYWARYDINTNASPPNINGYTYNSFFGFKSVRVRLFPHHERAIASSGF